MIEIYTEMLLAKAQKRKLLAILLDPEKVLFSEIEVFCLKMNTSIATHIFIGGSTFNGNHLNELIIEIKKYSNLPILLFPGDFKQISAEADGILFLSLLSGRNPDYLIEHQVNAVPFLQKTNLEVIPTAYLLIESGAETAVERVSKTIPLAAGNIDYVCQTAKAGELMGNKLVYLEAGSGAKNSIPLKMIIAVSNAIQIPLIVGGGIRSLKQIENAFQAGADLVVIGTAFENDNTFFDV